LRFHARVKGTGSVEGRGCATLEPCGSVSSGWPRCWR
jgi:hypothetical protein